MVRPKHHAVKRRRCRIRDVGAEAYRLDAKGSPETIDEGGNSGPTSFENVYRTCFGCRKGAFDIVFRSRFLKGGGFCTDFRARGRWRNLAMPE